MKEVKLLQLELTNYRNIEHEVYVFGGKNAKIVGENRIGKTNTLEAIYFLLTNYLLDGSSDLAQLKPLADTKKVVSVKGTFDIDGRTITIEKRYAEKWVKTRGTTDLVLDGHYETYLVNDIEQSKAGDYYDLLEEYFGIRNDKKGEVDAIQFLCNPLYLGNLGDSKDWTNLRSFIIKLIGDVSDEEVFQAEPTTLLIQEDLEKALGKTDQVKKMYENDIKGLSTAINGYDANINLLERTSRPTDEELAIARKGVEDTTAKINELNSNLENDTVTKDLEERAFELKKQVLDLNTKEYTAFQSKNRPTDSSKTHELEMELDKRLDTATIIKFALSKLESDKRVAETHVSSCNFIRDRLAKQYTEIKSQMADADKNIQTVCPTCGRPLEEEKVEEAKATYIAGLQEKLDNIVNEGKENTEELNKYKAQIIKCDEDIAKAEKDMAEANDIIAGIKTKIEDAKKEVSADAGTVVTYEESKELKDLRVKLAEVEDKLNEAKVNENKHRAEIYVEIEKYKGELASFQKVIGDYDYYCRQLKALEEVKDNKTKACQMLADVEQKKECLQLYNYTKLRLLDTHVASIFGNIKFQLIKENINGGFDPVCKPYIYDVEKNESTNTIWKSGSKSEKIVTGIAIVEAIRKELDLSIIPFLFDEGGEVSTDTLYNRLKTNAQIICVKVEDNISKPIVVNF